MRIKEEAALLWFFGEAPQSLGLKSVLGYMLEHQEGLAVGCSECRRCGGSGFRGGRPADIVEEAARGRLKDTADGTCDRCLGSGMVVRHDGSGAVSGCSTVACRSCKGATGNAGCPNCQGAGYLVVERAAPTTPPLPAVRDAHPTCSRIHSKFAALSRRLWRVGRRHAQTLGTFYGDPGHSWERRGESRLLSLYPLTSAGRRLLRKSGDGDSAEDVLLSLLHRQKVHPMPSRGLALGLVDSHARRLHRAAAEEWNAAA